MGQLYLGDNLKSIREEWGLSQGQFGYLVGASRGMIMQYENRGTKPKMPVLKELVKVTGLSRDILYNTKLDKEDMPGMSSAVSQTLEYYQSDEVIEVDDTNDLINAKSIKHGKNVSQSGENSATSENNNISGDKHVVTDSRNNTNTDKGAPYYENISASAGLDYLIDNDDNRTSSFIKVPGIRVDGYINVFGDSMYPKYCSGEVIGVKLTEKGLVFFGHAYVIQMSDGEAYIKYIRKGKDENHWVLESENEKYDPREFHLSKITKVFKIKAIIARVSL